MLIVLFDRLYCCSDAWLDQSKINIFPFEKLMKVCLGEEEYLQVEECKQQNCRS